MKNFLMLILALVLVWIVWGFVSKLIGSLISIGLILLFCFLVYNVYKALTKEKLKY